MKDRCKTKDQLISELVDLRQRITELNASETEWKRIAEELKESEEKYRPIFESANDGIMLLDTKGRISDVSKKLITLGGYTKEELVGKDITMLTEIITKESLLIITKNFVNRIAGMDIPPYEVQMIRKNGELADVEVSAVVIRKDGKIVGDLVILRDITERKRVEKELRENERRFRDIAENALEWIWEVGVDGKYTYTSPVVEKILGYKPGEILEKHFYDLFHPEDREKLKKAAFEAFSKNQPFRKFVNRNIHKNGKEVWLATSGVPILDKKGKLVGYRGADTDITERMRAEEVLRQSEQRYRTLAENQADGIGILDLEERFTFANPVAHDILGVPYGSLVGRKLEEFTDVENFKIVQAQTKLRKLGKKTTYDLEIVRPDGERRSLLVTATPRFDNEGQYTGTFGIFRDFTEQKRAEKIQASIYEISEAVHSAQNLEELFRSIHGIVGKLMPAKNFYIAFYDAATETLSFPYFVDEYDEPPAHRKISKGLTEYVLRTGKPLLASPEVFEELVKKGEVELMGVPSIDWLGVPLRKRDITIGVLAVQSYTEGIRFKEEDKRILRFVSAQVAMAIERKKAEREIKKRQKHLESLLHNTPNGIVTLDASHHILEWNPGAERLFGYTRDEVLGKDIDDLITRPDVRDEAVALTKQVLLEGKVLPLETIRYRKDGKPVSIIVAGSTIRVGDELHGVAAVYTDITERKELEAKLSAIHDFSRRISTLLQVKDVLNLTLDVVEKVLGHQHCAIHFVDPKTNQLYNKIHRGYSKKLMDNFRLPIDGPKGITAWVATSGKPIIVPDVQKDPRYVPGVEGAKSEMAAPLKVGDDVFGVIDVESTQPNAFLEDDLTVLTALASYVAIAIKNSLLFRDLAKAKGELEKWNLELENKVRERTQELRETQEQLLLSERLATIGQLAASVGHELRNPLGVLHNSLYLLNRNLVHADEKARKYLATMKKELLRSDKIISDLLDFSRKREPSFGPTDLNEVIEEVLSKVEIPEEVEVVRDLDKPQTVMADSAQLHSIFLNLISNGIQAMPDGGSLKVKTSRNNRFVEVKISDTGVGISRENLEKIFEPLFTTKSKGIGLGLSVAKRFVENHGGTIEIESNPNVGSTFIIKLPIKKRGE